MEILSAQSVEAVSGGVDQNWVDLMLSWGFVVDAFGNIVRELPSRLMQ